MKRQLVFLAEWQVVRITERSNIVIKTFIIDVVDLGTRMVYTWVSNVGKAYQQNFGFIWFDEFFKSTTLAEFIAQIFNTKRYKNHVEILGLKQTKCYRIYRQQSFYRIGISTMVGIYKSCPKTMMVCFSRFQIGDMWFNEANEGFFCLKTIKSNNWVPNYGKLR